MTGAFEQGGRRTKKERSSLDANLNLTLGLPGRTWWPRCRRWARRSGKQVFSCHMLSNHIASPQYACSFPRSGKAVEVYDSIPGSDFLLAGLVRYLSDAEECVCVHVIIIEVVAEDCEISLGLGGKSVEMVRKIPNNRSICIGSFFSCFLFPGRYWIHGPARSIWKFRSRGMFENRMSRHSRPPHCSPRVTSGMSFCFVPVGRERRTGSRRTRGT